MLKIIDYDKDEYSQPSLLVLGCFDSVHAGHQKLLKCANAQAEMRGLDLGIMTFENGKKSELIYTFDERLRLFGELKVQFVLRIDFNDKLRKTSAEKFLNSIFAKINIKGLMSGEDFRFGAGAAGNSATLQNYAEKAGNGFFYEAVKDLAFGDKKISTTYIKSLLTSGNIKIANALLTRSFSVTGKIVRGAGRGNKLLGFPTMNVEYPENKVKIKQGVYAVRGILKGKTYKGIANYGARPTFGEALPVLEVFLYGYDGSCYGENLTVEFIGYIRDIRKFGSAPELCAQLEKDLRFAVKEVD